MRRLRHRHDERGFALVIALGTMTVLSIVLVTVIDYTASNVRSAGSSKSSQVAYSLAEAGMGYALSVLNNALDPRTGSALPTTTVTLTGGTATFSGALSGTVWTITSTGSAKNPTGAGDVKRSLTRQVQVYGINAGATVGAWSRMYLDDTSACVTIPDGTTISGSFAARGNVCLNGTAQINGSSTKVAVGGNVTLQTNASIGSAGSPIAQADIAGSCQWSTNPAHQPCVPGDRVYANTMTSSPTQLTKPTVDFAYWYQNAAPGPLHGCDVSSGTPPTFDNNTVRDSSVAAFELTPAGSSYTCQAKDGTGAVIGELSWNSATKVLTIKGTIFIDASTVRLDDAGGAFTHYQGRATLYVGGTFKIGEYVCAGGSGTTDCRPTITSWDPTTNMLVAVVGGNTTLGNDFNTKDGAFQGVIYSNHDCDVDVVGGSAWSGPLLCNKISIKNGSTFSAWPPLGSLLAGQIYGSTSTSPDFQLSLGNQSG